MSDYNSSLTAQEIESVLTGAVVYNKKTVLTEAQKAQARKNIGAGSSDSGLVLLGYFETLSDLQTGVKDPSVGDAYGVGASYPYDIYIFDGLHSEWINNGNIRGADGKDGTDADVTAKNIKTALGYMPGMTNPNLIDNPWFRVNQRGESSYTGAVYGVDRWKSISNAITVTVNSDGSITIKNTGTSSAHFAQYIEDGALPAGTYTLSANVLSAAGTPNSNGIYGAAYIAYGAAPSFSPAVAITSINQNIYSIVLNPSDNVVLVEFSIAAGASITIKSVKLEQGSVSTLENDAPPNYGDQLMRCQRYYQRFTITNKNISLGLAVARSATTAAVMFNLLQPMRTYPTMSCKATFKLLGDVTKTAIAPEKEDAFTNMVRLNFTTSGLTANAMYLAASDSVGYMEFSADL